MSYSYIMVQTLNVNGKVLKMETIDKCINKDKCMSCKKPYIDMVYITKTGLGFCSIECMETFIQEWRKPGDDIKEYFNTTTSVITFKDEGQAMR